MKRWICAGIGLLATTCANAAIVTFNYAGVVKVATLEAATLAPVGSLFSGSFTYDDSIPVNSGGDPSYGRYFGAQIAGSFVLNGVSFVALPVSLNAPEVAVVNGSVDLFGSYSSFQRVDPDPSRVYEGGVAVIDPSGFTLSDIALQGLDPNAFPTDQAYGLAGPNPFYLVINDAGLQTSYGYLTGDFTSFSATTVPLPAAAWLLLSGLGGVASIARRRRALLVEKVAAA